ncbi:hypothetical protein SO802_001473 [Lithocarpus litseifolius]|uniref:Uncharacterized protein n=1 Tax=Lithocarpus litseifolius TaxID=425828 RepID=A0AAW2DW85_9ROSI
MVPGDRNTAFYHLSTLVKRKRNHILSIKDSAGEWIDDLIFFAKADIQNSLAIREVLDDFCSISGQSISEAKSRDYFSPNVSRELREELGDIIGFASIPTLVVYLVDAYDKERFAESKKELDALLSNEALANVLFLILGNKIDIPDAASEDELRFHLGLTNFTTGKGKVKADSNVRPLEVFMCSIVRKMGYGDGFKWLSQYIK